MSASQTDPAPKAPANPARRFSRWAIWSIAGVLLITGVGLAWAFAVNAQTPVATYEVVNVYPHDPEAFTQGLCFDEDGQLFEGTGLYGQSTLRKVDLKTGKSDESASFILNPQYFGEGVAVVGDRVYQLTWRNGVAFVFDRQSLKYLKSLPYRGEGWGLTYDGRNLVLSDGSAILRFVDPKSFRTVRRVRVNDGGRAVADLNELEYVEGEIYANIWHSDRVARISPKTGKVLGWIDLAGLLKPGDVDHEEAVLNGIAYDAKNKKLYVTGKNWPKLFEIRVKPK